MCPEPILLWPCGPPACIRGSGVSQTDRNFGEKRLYVTAITGAESLLPLRLKTLSNSGSSFARDGRHSRLCPQSQPHHIEWRETLRQEVFRYENPRRDCHRSSRSFVVPERIVVATDLEDIGLSDPARRCAGARLRQRSDPGACDSPRRRPFRSMPARFPTSTLRK